MVPEGAIKKDWGWQKQVFEDGYMEVWLCWANGQGSTSVHKHPRHCQTLHSISGHQTVEFFDVGSDTPRRRERSGSQAVFCQEGEIHRIVFESAGMFLEVYMQDVFDGSPDLPPVISVLEDIARVESPRPLPPVFAFG